MLTIKLTCMLQREHGLARLFYSLCFARPCLHAVLGLRCYSTLSLSPPPVCLSCALFFWLLGTVMSPVPGSWVLFRKYVSIVPQVLFRKDVMSPVPGSWVCFKLCLFSHLSGNLSSHLCGNRVL